MREGRRTSRSARYRIVGTLGHGAGGVVHLARDLRARRYVALKVNLPVGDPLAAHRFFDEQRVAVDHPHLLRSLDWYQEPDEAGLVLELADAGTLADVLAANERLPAAFVDGVAAQLIAGLAALHAAGVVHRDLKPANAVLVRSGAGVVAKLADFGISQIEGAPRLTQDLSSPLGTVGFLPPEVLAGGDHDRRSDVWALGTTILLLLDRVDPDDAGALRAVVARMVLDRPDRRPSAADLTGELPCGDRVPADGVALSDRAGRTIARARAATRRRASLVAAGAVLVGVLVALVASRSGDDTPSARRSASSRSTAPATAVGRSTTSTTADAPPDTSVAGSVLEPDSPVCQAFDSLTVSVTDAYRDRVDRFAAGEPAATAFGPPYADMTAGVAGIVALAADRQGMSDAAIAVGLPDDEISRALMLFALIAPATFDTNGAYNEPANFMTGIDVAAKDPAANGVPRDPDALSARMGGFVGITSGFEVRGCPNHFPERLAAPADVAARLLTPAPATVEEFFRRYDLDREILAPLARG